ncbi:hypothetical protein FJY63_00945 [Candidatus Sumerlaeota bacterium]|nr:hypothetical protein [Candidatus Sumerlaeota bacterium]
MATNNHSKWLWISFTAAIIAAGIAARVPYLRGANLSPDATDYISIARNIRRGLGPVLGIKWHFFTADPVIHSAIGERPLLYPLLLAPFCDGDNPARACQYATVAMAAAALALGAVWARSAGLSWQAAAVSAVLLAFNPGLLMCSVYPWTESLYLVWLFALLTVISRVRAPSRSAFLAALLTAVAALTRPSGPAIIPAVLVWCLSQRNYRALIVYVAALIVFFAPWWATVWIVRGNPFYSMQAFHLRVEDIRDGMAAGYGASFPSAIEFIHSHAAILLWKIAQQIVAYLSQLCGPTYLLLLSAFAFIALSDPSDWSDLSDLSDRHQRNGIQQRQRAAIGLAFVLALFHFALPSLVWATFDPTRFMLPCFAMLAIPAIGKADCLITRLATRRARLAAWLAILAVTAFFYADQWRQLYSRLQAGWQRDRAMQVARIEFDAIVRPDAVIAASDPFSLNYYFDRPTVILPEPADSSQRLPILERFLDEYRPDYLLAGRERVSAVAPLVSSGRLRPAGTIETVDLQVFAIAPAWP